MKNDKKSYAITLLIILAIIFAGTMVVANTDFSNQTKEQNKTITYKDSKNEKRGNNDRTVEIPNTSAIVDGDPDADADGEVVTRENTYIPATNYYSDGENSQSSHTDNGPVNPSRDDNGDNGQNGDNGDNGQNGENGQSQNNDNPQDPEDPYIYENDDPYDSNVKYMQTVTLKDVEEMDFDDFMTLVDKRDGKTYGVVKTNIWTAGGGMDTLVMVDDLALGSSEKPMMLTPKYTDISNNYVLPKSSDWEESDASLQNNNIVVLKEDLTSEPLTALNIDEYGDYHYTDLTAIATSDYSPLIGNNIYGRYNVSDSICPKGWHLPSHGSTYKNAAAMYTLEYYGNEVEAIARAEYGQTNRLVEMQFATSSIYNIDYGDDVYNGAKWSIPFNANFKSRVRCVWGNGYSDENSVTIDANGGTMSYWDQENDDTGYGESATFYYEALNVFNIENYFSIDDRDGYTLLGFSRNKDATEPDNDLIDDEYGLLVRDGDVIYAVWRDDNYIPGDPDDYIYEDNSPYDPNIKYMQTVNSRDIEAMSDDDSIQLVDKRNGKIYTAKKIKYNVFGSQYISTLVMTEDLEIGSDEKPMVLTKEYSDVSRSYILPKVNEFDEDSDEAQDFVIINDDGEYRYANKTAIASSDYSSMGIHDAQYNVYDSICPRGWHLPMTGSDYNNLYDPQDEAYPDEIGHIEYAGELWNEASEHNFANATLHMVNTDGNFAVGETWGVPFSDNRPDQVRCIWGPSLMEASHATINGNGGIVTYYDNNGYYFEGPVVKITFSQFNNDLEIDVEEREGYNFVGFSRDPNATDPDWDVTSLRDLRIDDNDVLYAVWKDTTPIVITYDANGGEFSDGTTENVVSYEGGRLIRHFSSFRNDNGQMKTSEADSTSYLANSEQEILASFNDGPIVAYVKYQTDSENDYLCLYEQIWSFKYNYDPNCRGSYDGKHSGKITTNNYQFKNDQIGFRFMTGESEWGNAGYGFWVDIMEERGEVEGNYDVPYLDDNHELWGWATTPDATEPEYCNNVHECADGAKSVSFIEQNTKLYAIYIQ